ncbi:hypothetical protein ACU4GD_27620 [Cupriavidus basilensis]
MRFQRQGGDRPGHLDGPRAATSSQLGKDLRAATDRQDPREVARGR